MSLAHPASTPLRFAGFTLSRWAFGLRTWAAMMLALYAAFWLQLSGASSAGTCVAILALPTRGQALAKAFYRSLATVVGVAASIAITGAFDQERDLFVIACAGWIGVCVLGANLLDGSRAYGVILSGYTVAIVSVINVDTPLDVFSSGVNRGAAIMVGILSVALVSDLSSAPNAYPKLLEKLSKVRRDVHGFACAVLRDGDARPLEAAKLMGAITGLHTEIEALAAEVPDGPIRAEAARGAIAGLVNMVGAARAFVLAEAAEGAGRSSALHQRLASALDAAGESDATMRQQSARDRLHFDPRGGRTVVERCASDLLLQHLLVADSLGDMACRRKRKKNLRLSVYRSFRVAAHRGALVGLAIVLSSAFFVLSSWPSTSSAVSEIAILGALSTNSPSPKSFVRGALMGVPAIIAIVGIIEFLVLDGVDEFPLLCLAMGPVILIDCMLLTSPDAKLKGLGFITLVLFPVILSPSNPQSYSASSYLVSSTMLIAAVSFLAFWMTVLPSISDSTRRRWYLRSAGRDMRLAIMGRSRRGPEAVVFRSANRIGQLVDLSAKSDAARAATVRHALLLHDILTGIVRVRAMLEGTSDLLASRGAVADGRSALRTLDAAALRRAAVRVERSPDAGGERERSAAREAAAELAFLASLIQSGAGTLRRLVPDLGLGTKAP